MFLCACMLLIQYVYYCGLIWINVGDFFFFWLYLVTESVYYVVSKCVCVHISLMWWFHLTQWATQRKWFMRLHAHISLLWLSMFYAHVHKPWVCTQVHVRTGLFMTIHCSMCDLLGTIIGVCLFMYVSPCQIEVVRAKSAIWLQDLLL